MPRSKKPRKPSKAKSYFSPYRMTPEIKAKMSSIFRDISLMAEMKVHRGTCTTDDFFAICGWMNMCAIAIRANARCWVDEDAAKEARPLVDKAVCALKTLRDRAKKSGKYICTSDELSALREAFPIADEVVQESIERCPRMFLKEWIAMKELTNTDEARCVRDFDRAFNRVHPEASR